MMPAAGSSFVYSGREEVFFPHLKRDGQALLSADVNQNGWLAVTSQEAGTRAQ